MNIWQVLLHLGAAISAVQDLAVRIAAFHSDPSIQAAIQANPALKAESDAISQDIRTIQNAL